MTWFRVDDSFADHPKVVALDDGPCRADALALWLLSGSRVGRWNLDGFISRVEVKRFAFKPKAADELVRVGLWVAAEGGYRFHDWLDRNPSREQVEEERAKTNARVTAFRKRKSNARVTPLQTPSVTPGETALPTLHPIPDPDPDPRSLSGRSSAEFGSGGAVLDRARKAPTPPRESSQKITSSPVESQLESEPAQAEKPEPRSPEVKPCWKLWAIWEELAGDGPESCGPGDAHKNRLVKAWASCAKRAPRDPEGLWRRMVAAYVAEKHEQNKRVDLGFLCDEFTGWADQVSRAGASNGPSHASYLPMPPMPKIPGER